MTTGQQRQEAEQAAKAADEEQGCLFMARGSGVGRREAQRRLKE